MNGQHQRAEFSNQSYMNPLPDRPKYQVRDAEVGRKEAELRLNSLPALEQKSAALSVELGFASPMLLPKGSASINMCTPDSDFDVAVVVQHGHIFTQKPELWREYQKALSEIEAGFRIEPRLVVENHLQTIDRLIDLVSVRNQGDIFTQDMLDKMKNLLQKNE